MLDGALVAEEAGGEDGVEDPHGRDDEEVDDRREGREADADPEGGADEEGGVASHDAEGQEGKGDGRDHGGGRHGRPEGRRGRPVRVRASSVAAVGARIGGALASGEVVPQVRKARRSVGRCRRPHGHELRDEADGEGAVPVGRRLRLAPLEPDPDLGRVELGRREVGGGGGPGGPGGGAAAVVVERRRRHGRRHRQRLGGRVGGEVGVPASALGLRRHGGGQSGVWEGAGGGTFPR